MHPVKNTKDTYKTPKFTKTCANVLDSVTISRYNLSY